MLIEMPRKRTNETLLIPGGAKRTRSGCARVAAMANGKTILRPLGEQRRGAMQIQLLNVHLRTDDEQEKGPAR